MIFQKFKTTLADGQNIQVIIRHALKSDLPMIWENFNFVVREKCYIPVISEITNKYEQDSWFYNHENGNNVIIVAATEDAVLGHCTVEHNTWECSEQVGELGILLHKKYRHAKPSIGKKLMENAIREAKLKGFEKIILSVFHTNENAIELYKEIGFVIIGVRKKQFLVEGKYYDEILMELFID
ncbi:MAG: GNAT family N-acetyltransferase [Candidatus Helarchaeota archaeon]